MEKLIKLIYHHHSGFSVQAGGTLLVFDYWEGDRHSLCDAGRITVRDLQNYEQIYVFVSHDHSDHFDEQVLQESLPGLYE